MKKSILITIILIIAIAGTAWYFIGKNTTIPGESENGEEATEAVATVNGEEISRANFNAAREQVALGQGLNIATLDSEAQAELQTITLNMLISQALLRQAVQGANISISESDMDNQVEEIKGQFESDQEYQTALSQEGLTESDLRSEIAMEFATQSYLEQTLNLSSITVSEEELLEVYAQIQSQEQGQIVPEFEELRTQLEVFVLEQKQQEAVNAHIQTLELQANIELLI